MPEVSVIVPVYNVEPYLRECLNSVLAQTFDDFELILIDDGSKDASGKICDEYALEDSRIRVIHQQNSGLGKARNVGMDKACGKYIIFLDSDDYWLSSTLDTLYTEAERNQTQVLIFGSVVFWDEVERPEGADEDYCLLTAQNNVVKPGPESMKISFDNNEFNPLATNRFYLRSYLQSKELRFDEGIICEDVSFSFLSYLFAERVECIGAQLYRYRKRPGSIMTSASIRKFAHGYRVALDRLWDVWLSYSDSENERLLLERNFRIYIIKIVDLYGKARNQKDCGTARFVQRELGPTLKKARALPNLSVSLRCATYSLYLNWLLSKIIRKIKRLVSG